MKIGEIEDVDEALKEVNRLSAKAHEQAAKLAEKYALECEKHGELEYAITFLALASREYFKVTNEYDGNRCIEKKKDLSKQLAKR